MIKITQTHITLIGLFLLATVFYMQGLHIHGLEYRDDEIFYFQSTKEMGRTGDVMSPKYFGENRFQKPILYYWMILLSYKVWGVNWVGARFVAVVCAALILCLTWRLAKDMFGRSTAWLSTIILAINPLFFRHAKNAVPDMPLNLCIVAALFCFWEMIHDRHKQRNSALFFLFCALGFMIKGIAAIAVPIVIVLIYSLRHKTGRWLRGLNFFKGFGIMLMVILPWFFYMIYLHGQDYLTYMLESETKDRLVSAQGGHFLLNKGRDLFLNMGFYLKVMLSYFAPWCFFGFLALPALLFRQYGDLYKRQSLSFLLIWFWSVFIIFSFMHVVLNHYILVLTSPFAILVSHFLLWDLQRFPKLGKIKFWGQKYILLFFLTIGTFAFSFLLVFLAGQSKMWLIFLWGLYVWVVWRVHRSSNLLIPPLALGVFMVCVFSQSWLMDRAKVTAHSSLQRFATAVHQQQEENYVVGVGSNDIHEKEWQVYFDQPIQKVANSSEEETRQGLKALFAQNDQPVYCLVTEEDFMKHLQPFSDSLEIVREDYIFRKRMYLDKGFATALMRLDQDKVYQYLMEKLILVKQPVVISYVKAVR